MDDVKETGHRPALPEEPAPAEDAGQDQKMPVMCPHCDREFDLFEIYLESAGPVQPRDEEPGGFQIRMRSAALPMIGQAFLDLLKAEGAENYCGYTLVQDYGPSVRILVQIKGKETPEEQNARLKQKVSQLKTNLRTIAMAAYHHAFEGSVVPAEQLEQLVYEAYNLLDEDPTDDLVLPVEED